MRVTCLATAALSARLAAKVDPIASEGAPATGAATRVAGAAARIRQTPGTLCETREEVAFARAATGAN